MPALASRLTSQVGDGARQFKAPSPVNIYPRQTTFALWPAQIYWFLLNAMDKGFSNKISKRRFLGHFDNH